MGHTKRFAGHRAGHNVRTRQTRSKGKILASDPAQNTALLTSQLNALGLYAAPTLGDGNCLFRALADQYYGSPSKHVEVRRDICDWIESHPQRYEGFVDEDEFGSSGLYGDKKGKGKLDHYLRRMRENATYGGHMELSAFAHLTRRNIKVIQPGLVYIIQWNPSNSPVQTSKELEDDSNPADDDDDDEARQDSDAPGTGEKRSSKRREKQRKKEEMRKKKRDQRNHEHDEDEDVDQSDVADDDDTGDQDPTIYVAYHDWEHFSSIRNLRGPHVGLPCIRETPADSHPQPPSPPPRPPRSKAKSDRSPPAQKETKENSAAAKIKLKVSQPPSASISQTTTPETSSATTAVSDPSPTPAVAQPSLKIRLRSSRSLASPVSASLPLKAPTPSSLRQSALLHNPHAQHLVDPVLVPLPSSGSATPIPPVSCTPSDGQPLSRSVSPEGIIAPGYVSHLHAQAKVHPLPASLDVPALRAGRSPKRTFDESSEGSSSASSGGSETKRRKQERNIDTESMVIDIEQEHDVQNDSDSESATDGSISASDDDELGDASPPIKTPFLSPAGSTSSSSSSSRSLSGDLDLEGDLSPLSSLPSTPSPEPELQPPPKSGKKKGSVPKGERPLTRRERKRLGLPKERKELAVPVGVRTRSAGKIIIPGGKFLRNSNPSAPPSTLSVGGEDDEWRRNGSGRVDVRGFRELKI